jgi:hypothetical protein
MPSSAHRLVALILLAAGISYGAVAAVDLDQSWKAAVQAERIQAPNERVRLFSEWIDAARVQGVKSSEAHHHLALAHWEKKEPGKAVFHLMESAKLRQNPFSALGILGQVHQIESEQSIRDGVSASPMLYLHFIFTPNVITFFGALAVWCLIASFFLWWYRSLPVGRVQISLWLLAGLFATVPLMGLVSRSLLKPVSVTEGAALGVFQTAEAKEDSKIISLPAGILVVGEETSGKMRHISQPLSGWVEAKGLLPLDLLTR